jgi:hypothetical protein
VLSHTPDCYDTPARFSPFSPKPTHKCAMNAVNTSNAAPLPSTPPPISNHKTTPTIPTLSTTSPIRTITNEPNNTTILHNTTQHQITTNLIDNYIRYYSTTTASQEARDNTEKLRDLLEAKDVDQRVGDAPQSLMQCAEVQHALVQHGTRRFVRTLGSRYLVRYALGPTCNSSFCSYTLSHERCTLLWSRHPLEQAYLHHG